MDRFREVEPLPLVHQLVAVDCFFNLLFRWTQDLLQLGHPEQGLFQIIVIKDPLYVLLVLQPKVVFVISAHILLNITQYVIIESEAWWQLRLLKLQRYKLSAPLTYVQNEQLLGQFNVLQYQIDEDCRPVPGILQQALHEAHFVVDLAKLDPLKPLQANVLLVLENRIHLLIIYLCIHEVILELQVLVLP